MNLSVQKTKLLDISAKLVDQIAEHKRKAKEAIGVQRDDEKDGRVSPADMELQQAQAKSKKLQLIQGAMGRTDDGTYGQCRECGDEISLARLNEIPWADRCISCEEKDDWMNPNKLLKRLAKRK